MGIRGKLIILLVSIFFVLFAAFAALVSINLHQTVEEQLLARLDVTSGLIRTFSYKWNHETLQRIASVVKGEVLVISVPNQGGQWEAIVHNADSSSFDDARLSDVEDVLRRDAGQEIERRVLIREGFSSLGLYMIVDVIGDEDRQAVCLFLAADEVDGYYGKAYRRMFFVGAGLLFFLCVTAIVLGRAMSQPLLELSQQARRVAEGDLDASVSIYRNDEIGQLALSFNAMLNGLKDAQEKLLRSEKLAALGQLTTGVAHEVKNPLASLKMTAQLLRGRSEEAGTCEGLDVMLSEIERLQIYLDELLLYSHQEELRLKRQNLNVIVEDVLAMTARQFEHTRIDVELELGTLPETEFDPAKMKQVIVNLILNAAQASTPGQVITVGTECVGSGVRFFVRDRGCGVAAEDVGKIYLPFYSRKEGGTGLGLAVSKTIVEAHGGCIGFDGMESGTMFWFELKNVTV